MEGTDVACSCLALTMFARYPTCRPKIDAPLPISWFTQSGKAVLFACGGYKGGLGGLCRTHQGATAHRYPCLVGHREGFIGR